VALEVATFSTNAPTQTPTTSPSAAPPGALVATAAPSNTGTVAKDVFGKDAENKPVGLDKDPESADCIRF